MSHQDIKMSLGQQFSNVCIRDEAPLPWKVAQPRAVAGIWLVGNLLFITFCYEDFPFGGSRFGFPGQGCEKVYVYWVQPGHFRDIRDIFKMVCDTDIYLTIRILGEEAGLMVRVWGYDG